MTRKLTIFALIMLIGLFAFCACKGKDEEAPEGLQVIKSSETEGYIFYGPEGWTVANTDDIAGAKVFADSRRRPSVTFTEAKMPETTIPEYFSEALKEFPEAIASTRDVKVRDEACIFGNANGEAYKYIYTYSYDGLDVACMQILLTHNERFYIFTYTSFGDVNDPSSHYSMYLDKINQSIENFTFTERKGEASKPEYERDADGYIMISDPKLSKFSLYVPENYEVIYSSGFVKAKISDGANISLTRATDTNVSILDYLVGRKDNMKSFTTDFEDISLVTATPIEDKDNPVYKNFDCEALYDAELTFGDLGSKVIAYEYKYTFNNQVYHVYQLMGVNRLNGFVFTYTALESEYYRHLDEIKTILEKVRF